MKNIIEVKNLTKEYKNLKAIDDLSFEVHEGEILGLLGPNGSGKSTTINCILSLLKFEKGTIQIFGRPMAPNAYDTKREIGVVFQDVRLEELTVEENNRIFLGLYVNDKVKKQLCTDHRTSGLNEFKKLSQLCRRLLEDNIAWIAHKPNIIFLDGPHTVRSHKIK